MVLNSSTGIPFRPLACLTAVHEFLTASILGWFATLSSSGSHFLRTLQYDPSVLGGPTPWVAWLRVSLSHASPFATTSQRSMKGGLLLQIRIPVCMLFGTSDFISAHLLLLF